MRTVLTHTFLTITLIVMVSGLSQAQSNETPAAGEALPAAALFPAPSAAALFTAASNDAGSAPSMFSPPSLDLDTSALFAQQPAGAPPTPRHTGVKALTKHLVTDWRYVPVMENVYWAGLAGGLALAVHPADDNVNRALVGNDTADNIFKAGEILGESPTLFGSAAVVYAIGRMKDKPKVSHLGMDLLEALAMSEVMTQSIKYTVRRERPDGSSKNSFPSGHAADTFAFATALERHLNWHYSVPAYIFSSYVAISRLPANRHWLSDAVFGAGVGIIAGRTVTSHESERPYPVAVTPVPGGVAIMYTRNK